MINKFSSNSDQLLKIADTFYKRAQGFGMTTEQDPMKKALDQAIGNIVKQTVIQSFQKSVSEAQVNIEFDPNSKTAKFTVYGTGTPEDQAELTANLNKLSMKAYSIMVKYMKTPFDYKYVTYQR